MPCYYPLKGWISSEINNSGKRSIVFQKSEALCPVEISIPCGQCIGCRLDRSSQWAIRCYHESTLYDSNCFITLTFDDNNLGDGSLHKADFQKFLKRMRKRVGRFRYFHCGEYGDNFQRPHHHACIFGYDFPDKLLLRERAGIRLYTSDILRDLWPFGYHTIGDVTYESACYVARYCLKKLSYDKRHPDRYGAYYAGRQPEYSTMSRRPGIGFDWYDKFSADVYPHGYVMLAGGVKVKPPVFYDNKFSVDNPEAYVKLKVDKSRRAFLSPNNTPSQLAIRGYCAEKRVRDFGREVENGSSDCSGSGR